MTVLALAIAGDDDDDPTVIDTGLQGDFFDTPEHGYCFVVPFASAENAVDCLRILAGTVQREAEEG